MLPWATATDPYYQSSQTLGWCEDLGLGADEFVGDATE